MDAAALMKANYLNGIIFGIILMTVLFLLCKIVRKVRWNRYEPIGNVERRLLSYLGYHPTIESSTEHMNVIIYLAGGNFFTFRTRWSKDGSIEYVKIPKNFWDSNELHLYEYRTKVGFCYSSRSRTNVRYEDAVRIFSQITLESEERFKELVKTLLTNEDLILPSRAIEFNPSAEDPIDARLLAQVLYEAEKASEDYILTEIRH